MRVCVAFKYASRKLTAHTDSYCAARGKSVMPLERGTCPANTQCGFPAMSCLVAGRLTLRSSMTCQGNRHRDHFASLICSTSVAPRGRDRHGIRNVMRTLEQSTAANLSTEEPLHKQVSSVLQGELSDQDVVTSHCQSRFHTLSTHAPFPEGVHFATPSRSPQSKLSPL